MRTHPGPQGVVAAALTARCEVQRIRCLGGTLPTLLRGFSLAFLLVLLVAGCASGQTYAGPQPGVIRLATGPKDGVYRSLGEFARQEVGTGNYAKRGLARLDLLETQGSAQNVTLLETCAAELAFIQSDIFHEALRGHGHDKFRQPAVQLSDKTFPAYGEYVQILVPPHSTVHKVTDLRGKRVLIGLADSGTARTALTILRTASLELERDDFIPVYGRPNAEQLKEDFKQGRVDAAFFATALPNRVIKDLTSADPEFRLISLENELIRDLISEGAYVAASISSSNYWGRKWYEHSDHNEPAPPNDVSTVAIEALLVSRKGYENQATELLNVLKKQRAKFEAQYQPIKLDLIVPFFHRLSTLGLFLLPVAGAIVLHILLGRYKKVRIHLEILAVLTFFFGVGLLAAFGLWFFEHRYNPYFETFGKSCRSMVSYVAGRLEGRMPMTPQGEFLALVSIIFGLGLVAWFTAELAGRLVKGELGAFTRLLERRKSMLRQITDHTVIFNWDARVPLIIQQLRHRHPALPSPASVLITPTAIDLPPEISEDMIPLIGRATDSELLKKARVQYARSVVILSSWPTVDPNDRRRLDPDTADSKTTMTIMAIRSLCADRQSQVPITAEIMNRDNMVAAQQCSGATGGTELICVEDFGREIFALCAVTPELAGVYTQLLNATGTGNGIRKVRLPEGLIGRFFSDVLHWYAKMRPSDSPQTGVPIGVYRAPNMFINPADGALGALIGTDELFVITCEGSVRSQPRHAA